MNKFLSLFQDENGQLSAVRAMAFLFVINYIVKDQAAFWMGGDSPGINSLVVALGSIGFKVLSKPFEKKAQ